MDDKKETGSEEKEDEVHDTSSQRKFAPIQSKNGTHLTAV
jgi:hypothetical protein